MFSLLASDGTGPLALIHTGCVAATTQLDAAGTSLIRRTLCLHTIRIRVLPQTRKCSSYCLWQGYLPVTLGLLLFFTGAIYGLYGH